MDYRDLETPIGPLLLAGDGSGLRRIEFRNGRRPQRRDSSWRQGVDAFDDVVAELMEYFAGRRQRFELSLAPDGTLFQQRVWRALLD